MNKLFGSVSENSNDQPTNYDEYIQICNKDMDYLYINMSTGSAAWILPDNTPVNSISFVAHLSEKNHRYYYEDLHSQAVTWSLPANMYSVGKSNAAAIQNMNRLQCEEFIQIPYDEQLSNVQVDQLDEYLQYIEEGHDPDSFVSSIIRPPSLSSIPASHSRPISASSSSNNIAAAAAADEPNPNQSRASTTLKKLASTQSIDVSEDSDEEDEEEEDGGQGPEDDEASNEQAFTIPDHRSKNSITIQELKECYVKRGILMKQAVISKRNWKKRVFSLTEYCLRYYENNYHSKAKGEFPISADTAVETLGFLNNPTDFKFNFHVYSRKGNGEDLLLSAHTEAQREEWIKALTAVINKAKTHTRGYITRRSTSILTGNKSKYFILNQNLLTCHPDENKLSTIDGLWNINISTSIEMPEPLKGNRRLVIHSASSTSTALDLLFPSHGLDYVKWKNALFDSISASAAASELAAKAQAEAAVAALAAAAEKNEAPVEVKAEVKADDKAALKAPTHFSFGNVWDDEDDEEENDSDREKGNNEDDELFSKERMSNVGRDNSYDGPMSIALPSRNPPGNYNSDYLSPLCIKLYVSLSIIGDKRDKISTSPGSSSSSSPKNGDSTTGGADALQAMLARKAAKANDLSNSSATTSQSMNNSMINNSSKPPNPPPPPPPSAPRPQSYPPPKHHSKEVDTPSTTPPGRRSLFGASWKRNLGSATKSAIAAAVSRSGVSPTNQSKSKVDENSASEDEITNKRIADRVQTKTVSFRSDYEEEDTYQDEEEEEFSPIKEERTLTISSKAYKKDDASSSLPSPLTSSSFNLAAKKPVTAFSMKSTVTKLSPKQQAKPIPVQNIFINEMKTMVSQAYKDQASPKSPILSFKSTSSSFSPTLPMENSPQASKTDIPLSLTPNPSPVKPSMVSAACQTDNSQYFYDESHKNTYALLLAEREAILQAIAKKQLEEEASIARIQAKEQESLLNIRQNEERSQCKLADERHQFEDYKKKRLYQLEVQEKQVEINRLGLERQRMEIEALAAKRSHDALQLTKILYQHYQRLIQEKEEIAKERFRVDLLIRQLTSINQELYKHQYQQRLQSYYPSSSGQRVDAALMMMKPKRGRELMTSDSKTMTQRPFKTTMDKLDSQRIRSRSSQRTKKSSSMTSAGKPASVTVDLKTFTINPQTNKIEVTRAQTSESMDHNRKQSMMSQYPSYNSFAFDDDDDDLEITLPQPIPMPMRSTTNVMTSSELNGMSPLFITAPVPSSTGMPRPPPPPRP
jgi:hypothetical protein